MLDLAIYCESVEQKAKQMQHFVEKNSVGRFLDSELPLQRIRLTWGSFQKKRQVACLLGFGIHIPWDPVVSKAPG